MPSPWGDESITAGSIGDPAVRWSAFWMTGLLVACTAIVGGTLYAVMRVGPVARFDETATARLHELAIGSTTVEQVARAVSWLGHPLVLAAVVAVASLRLLQRRRDLVVWLVATTAIGAAVETGLKLVIQRSRPDVETTFVRAHGMSFPSGHAMNTTIVLVAIALVHQATATRHRWIPLAAGIAFVVGLSRPILGVHYVSDVSAGFLLAALWLSGMWAIGGGRPSIPQRARGQRGAVSI